MGLTKRAGVVDDSIGSDSVWGSSETGCFSVLGRKRLGLTKRLDFVDDSSGASVGDDSSDLGLKRLGLTNRLDLVDDSVGSCWVRVWTSSVSVVDSAPANSFQRRGRGLLKDGTRVGSLPRFVVGLGVVLVVVVAAVVLSSEAVLSPSSGDGIGCFCCARSLAFSFMAAIRSL